MKSFTAKKSYSSTGANFAPSSRSAVNSAVNAFLSDTAIAVSVLFSLIILRAIIISSDITVTLVLALITAFIITTRSNNAQQAAYPAECK